MDSVWKNCFKITENALKGLRMQLVCVERLLSVQKGLDVCLLAPSDGTGRRIRSSRPCFHWVSSSPGYVRSLRPAWATCLRASLRAALSSSSHQWSSEVGGAISRRLTGDRLGPETCYTLRHDKGGKYLKTLILLVRCLRGLGGTGMRKYKSSL